MIQEPILYTNSNSNVQNIIKHLGTNMFLKLGLDKKTNDDLLQIYLSCNGDVDINEAIDKALKIEKEVSGSIEKQLRELNDSYKETINELQKQISKMNYEIEEKVSKESSKIINMYQEKENNYKETIERLKKEGDVVNFMEENFIEKKQFKNPTEQGDYAEKILDKIVNDVGLPYDDKATCKDTSEGAGSGDRIITFSNGFRLMIEVKNKDKIKNTDIQEYEDHYSKDFENNNIDKALFLSYRTPQIPKIGKAICLLDVGNVYYYGLMDELTLDEKYKRIEYCLEDIYKRNLIEKKCVSVEKSENNNCLINICESHIKSSTSTKKSLEKKIKQSTKDIEQYQKELVETETQLNNIQVMVIRDNIQISRELVDPKIYKKNLIERIKKWKKDDNISIDPKKWKSIICNTMPGLTEMDKGEINKLRNITEIQ